MKITQDILSIPPYLSTRWKNVAALHVVQDKQGLLLVVTLKNQTEVTIPNLSSATLEQIFNAHLRAIETRDSGNLSLSSFLPIRLNLPLNGEAGDIINSTPPAMQHNPEQANLPPLPPEALKKITSIAEAFGLEPGAPLPSPEPDCNCLHCQILRAFHLKQGTSEEELITAEDLTFKDWEIQETTDKLYKVTNPLDRNEHYNVFLGTPIGCTCGQKNCEHIQAVLKT